MKTISIAITSENLVKLAAMDMSRSAAINAAIDRYYSIMARNWRQIAPKFNASEKALIKKTIKSISKSSKAITHMELLLDLPLELREKIKAISRTEKIALVHVLESK